MPALRLYSDRGENVMTPLEALLRISVVRAELLRLADVLDPKTARLLAYAARIIALVPHQRAPR
jgi:hypothetical protein